MSRHACMFTALGLAFGLAGTAGAAVPSLKEFQPDPASVLRYGPAYRYPQAGWIILHIEGEPHERGYQHGRLMASEIVGYLRCFASLRSPKAPAEGWRNTRTLVNSLFLRRYDREYLEEMKGIADGASAAGARFDDRPIDLVDVVGINSWAEIETLDSALEATATGLEGIRFPNGQPRAMPEPKPMHCSAFAATGPATADGKIVFGHITMFGLYPAPFYNIWLDVKPARGHRVVMQTYPGGIQSGMDYYLNDAGLLVCETTIAQTRFDIQGMALGSRIRQVLQYADSIDRAVEFLKNSNNGLYTNEWLLGDTKTNEIAMFELGTGKTKLYRSSRNEWFGGTSGFYWGCNNAKDMDVRLETIPGVNDRPANVVWHPSDRDLAWQRLYAEHRGRIDLRFGQKAFTTPPLAACSSLDAKVTTSFLAGRLQTIALFGPPLGRSWQPTPEERALYPEVRPLVSNPWTLLGVATPTGAAPPVAALDLPDRVGSKALVKDEHERHTDAAWLGTLLPGSDGDVWLASAFADYEKIVALENAMKREHVKTGLTAADRERLGIDLFSYRARLELGTRAGGQMPLSRIRSQVSSDDWYRVAAGKGVLVLHELRKLMEDEPFHQLMESFGKEHAGREVASAVFEARAQEMAATDLKSFFDAWIRQPGLPTFHLANVRRLAPDSAGSRLPATGAGYTIEGDISRDGPDAPAVTEITVDTSGGEVTESVSVAAGHGHFRVVTKDRPLRVTLDKYGLTAKTNGGPFSILSFYAEPGDTVIVYGTVDEGASNQEAAGALQKALRLRWSNISIPILSDVQAREDVLRGHHVLLIGRPDNNRCLARFHDALPLSFGSRSFVVRSALYAHSGTGVIAAASNPMNPRYSLVVVAGLSAESTLAAAEAFARRGLRSAEVLVLPHDGAARGLTVPTRELVHEFAGR